MAAEGSAAGLVLPLEVERAVAGIRAPHEAAAEEDTHFEHREHQMQWPHQEQVRKVEDLGHKVHKGERVRQARKAAVQIPARRDKDFEVPGEGRWVQDQSDNVRSQV